MSSSKMIVPKSNSPLAKIKGVNVKIRSYQSSDYDGCRKVFTEGMEQLISLVARVVLPKYCWILAALGVLVSLAAFMWTFWILTFYTFLCVFMMAFLYVNIYIECWKFINSCLATDLKDIEKTYMSGNGSHMWVAEWEGKVVGMVGLVNNCSHKPRVAELQRMSVSTVCRGMGIAKKLLDELCQHAKDQRFGKLVLTTTSAQIPAVRLYKKWGFNLIAVFPYPRMILGDLQYLCFGLELK